MDQILYILFILFIVVFALQMIYFGGIFTRFSFNKEQVLPQKNVPVSVLICAKNEHENLKKFLPLYVAQEYSNFELIVIDDASSDDSIELLEEYERNYNFFKLVKVKNNEAFWGNKKYALTLGIKAAQHEYLLFTDADCYPSSKQWISQMTSSFIDKKTIVLGYGAYTKSKSFLNKLIRFETLLTAIQYFSWAKLGLAYMGVGRNLSYKKSEFFKVNGFIDHMKLYSGDDDLFVNRAQNKTNVAIQTDPNSFTYSNPKTKFSEWILQKRRHITTSRYYRFFDKLQLGLFYISQLFFLLLAIILLVNLHNWILVASLILIRYVFNWIVIYRGAKKLNEKDLVPLYPLLELVLIYIQIQVFITNIFSKPKIWR